MKREKISKYAITLKPGEGTTVGLGYVKYTFPDIINLRRGDELELTLSLIMDESGVAQVQHTEIYIIQRG